MIFPPYLQPGALIGITCPSGYVSQERVSYCQKMLELWGFKVKMGSTVGKEHFYFAGTDEERAADLQQMMDDPAISAILMGRGGYGMSRIIDRLDFTGFMKAPKWICGFSDITVLHNHLQAQYEVASLHSPMCGHFREDTVNSDFMKSFYAAITGESNYYHIAPSIFNRVGEASGILTGGNLAILAHLTGSASEVSTAGKILFIEDIGEHLYNIDRMLMNLKRAGKLSDLKGLLVGGFTDLQDTERPFGQTVEAIISEKVKEYSYPVCFNVPVGHRDINYTLKLGATHKLIVNEKGCTLEVQP